MKGLVIAFFAILVVVNGSPSGLGLSVGLGLTAPRTVIVPSSSAAVITKPVQLVSAYNVAPTFAAGPIITPVPALTPLAPYYGPASPYLAPFAPAGIHAPVVAPVAPAAAVAVTNGGGVVEVSGHGAVVSGPKTVPVVIDGPSGTVKASGLWGPTLSGVLH